MLEWKKLLMTFQAEGLSSSSKASAQMLYNSLWQKHITLRINHALTLQMQVPFCCIPSKHVPWPLQGFWEPPGHSSRQEAGQTRLRLNNQHCIPLSIFSSPRHSSCAKATATSQAKSLPAYPVHLTVAQSWWIWPGVAPRSNLAAI